MKNVGRDRRRLPEAAYDFFARDGRDGERGEVRDTLAEAQADVRAWRQDLPEWKRCVIEVCWRLNEKKILRLIDGRRTPRAKATKP